MTITDIKRNMIGRQDLGELRYAARRYERMAEQPNLDRVWDIIELVGVCMLTTRFAGGLRARPLQSRPDRDAGIIWFVTNLRSAKGIRLQNCLQY